MYLRLTKCKRFIERNEHIQRFKALEEKRIKDTRILGKRERSGSRMDSIEDEVSDRYQKRQRTHLLNFEDTNSLRELEKAQPLFLRKESSLGNLMVQESPEKTLGLGRQASQLFNERSDRSVASLNISVKNTSCSDVLLNSPKSNVLGGMF